MISPTKTNEQVEGQKTAISNHVAQTQPEQKDIIYRIGILGAAKIAPEAVIDPALKITNCVVQGVAARSKEKAEAFAKEFNIPKVFNSYEDLINSDEIDIVYNPLPNGYHAYYSILALKKGKHVLCEKPFASNTKEVDQVIAALSTAPDNSITKSKPLIIEALHDKFHPLSLKLRDMAMKGEFGDIEKIKIRFQIPWYKVDKKDIRYNVKGENPELAGGALMDIGCYATSIFKMIAAPSLTKSLGTYPRFEISSAKIKETYKHVKGVDKSAKVEMAMFFDGVSEKKVVGDLSLGYNSWKLRFYYDIIGTKKKITVTNPLGLHNAHVVTETDVDTKKKKKWAEYGDGNTTYYYQLKHFIQAVNGDKASQELCQQIGGMDAAKYNMQILDEIYKKAGSTPRIGKDCTQL